MVVIVVITSVGPCAGNNYRCRARMHGDATGRSSGRINGGLHTTTRLEHEEKNRSPECLVGKGRVERGFAIVGSRGKREGYACQ